MKQRLIFATGNEHKMKEIREILDESKYEIISMKEAGVDIDIVEDGKTFEENALIKAKAVMEVTGQLTLADGQTKVIRGTMEGIIGYEIKGENGFGYDPIFYLPQYGKYSAELSSDEKNAISHRGEALRRIREVL